MFGLDCLVFTTCYVPYGWDAYTLLPCKGLSKSLWWSPATWMPWQMSLSFPTWTPGSVNQQQISRLVKPGFTIIWGWLTKSENMCWLYAYYVNIIIFYINSRLFWHPWKVKAEQLPVLVIIDFTKLGTLTTVNLNKHCALLAKVLGRNQTCFSVFEPDCFFIVLLLMKRLATSFDMMIGSLWSCFEKNPIETVS